MYSVFFQVRPKLHHTRPIISGQQRQTNQPSGQPDQKQQRQKRQLLGGQQTIAKGAENVPVMGTRGGVAVAKD